MPLAFQQVPIPFRAGLDTRSDPKAAPVGRFTTLENAVFTKVGSIGKRFGYDVLPKRIDGGAGTIAAARAVRVFRDELLLYTGTRVYSYSPATEAWVDRGRMASATITTKAVIRGSFTQSNPDVGYAAQTSAGGIIVTAWQDSRGGIRYSVEDATTGAFFVADAAVHATAVKPRLVTHQNEVVLFYVAGANLFYRRISPASPATLGAEINILSTLHATNNHHDEVAVGDRLFIAFADAANAAVIRYLDSAWALAAASATSVNPIASAAISVFTDAAQNIWCVGATATEVFALVVSFGLMSIIAAFVSVEAVANVRRIAGVVPTSPGTEARILYEIAGSSTTTTRIRSNTLTTAGVVGTASDFLRSVGLGSKVFAYDGGYYFAVLHESTLQATTFVATIDGDVIGRLTPGKGGPLRSVSTVSAVPSPRAGAALVAAGEKGSLSVETGKLFTPVGVLRAELDFVSVQRFASARLDDNFVTAGGLLQAYDGVSYVEHGFLLHPEGLTSETGALTIVVTQQGTAALPEITDVTLPAASRIKSGQYFTFHAPTPTSYYCWFDVDGAAGDPLVAGHTAVRVAVNNYDTAATVAAAIQAAINPLTDVDATVAGTVVTITNVASGPVTDAANAAAPNGVATGSVATGTYNYRAVYEWTDAFGQIHVSAPSPAFSVTPAGPAMVSIGLPTLRLTQRRGTRAHARIALYRTTASGIISYRVSSLRLPLNDPTRDAVYITDTLTDAQLVGNELLYTVGGVLEHIAPESVSLALPYRGRVFLAGTPEGTGLIYSKAAATSGPAAFSADSLRIEVAEPPGPITAIAVLDEKLIIFKERAILALAGDGPNDRGERNDFGVPQLIAADVGCATAASVVTTSQGVLFRSLKGLYLLDRSLQVVYLGAAVEAFNALVLTGAALVPNTNEVRVVGSAGTALVYDYLVGQWSTFTNHPAVGCDVWRGQFVYARSDGSVYVENRTKYTDGDASIRLRAETGWINLAGQQGLHRVRRLGVLGEYRSAHRLKISVATDYFPTYTQSAIFDATTVLGLGTYGSGSPYGADTPYGGPFSPYQIAMHVERQKCSAVRVLLEEDQNGPLGEGLSLAGLQLEVGMRGGLARVPAQRRL